MRFCSSGESLRAGMPHSKVVVLERRFADINSVDVLYKKKRGFLFGWGGAPNDLSLASVTIEEIRSNNKLVLLSSMVSLLHLFLLMVIVIVSSKLCAEIANIIMTRLQSCIHSFKTFSITFKKLLLLEQV